MACRRRLASRVGHLHRQIAHVLGAGNQCPQLGRLTDHGGAAQRVVLRRGAGQGGIDIGELPRGIRGKHGLATGVVACHHGTVEHVVGVFGHQHRAEHRIQVGIRAPPALRAGVLPCSGGHPQLRATQPLQVHGYAIPVHAVAARELLAPQAPHAVVAEAGGCAGLVGQRGDPTVVVDGDSAHRTVGRFRCGWQPQLLRNAAFPC
ncbi:hypothetical protein D3C75_468340 [compost metagenome]